MSIETDSLSLEAKKNPQRCNVFNIYKLIASKDQISVLKKKYEAGNFGYGHAKQELFDLILQKYSKEREKYNYLMQNQDVLEKELKKGAKKAKIIACNVLARVRNNIGY